jgi:magnesium-transporting ATPase (P-type)
MDAAIWRRRLPTFFSYWEKRQKAARNRLPKHLRPPSRWPILLQIALNLGIFIALTHLMWNKEEFLTDAGPAITMVVCFLLLIYSMITAVRLRLRYRQTRGQRWASLNFYLMILAFLSWPAAVAVFLP